MFEITFLGTSASAPSVHRNLPAQLVKHDEFRFLIDCGEGTQRQILQAGVGFKRLNRILITHGHLDHILGLAGLISTLMRWETMEELEIFGGNSAIDRIRDLIHGVVLRGTRPPMPIHLRTIAPGTFLDTDDFSVTAFQVHHRGSESLGYLFEEKGRRPFLPEKAETLQIPPGSWRRRLVLGERVTLPDGREIDPDTVLGNFKPGTRFAHIGDSGEIDSLVETCRSADTLVIEATYLHTEADLARQYSHLTAYQAAELACRAGARKLILTHISRRYREKDVLSEAQAIFPNTVVARDFDTYLIKREE
ncbi:MAG: ribonuclease Z [Anaerolineaceae bacterium]|nr:ribonuclease Z [Anaerolineaceae bacterium]